MLIHGLAAELSQKGGLMALVFEKGKKPTTTKAPAATRPPMKKSASAKAARPLKAKAR